MTRPEQADPFVLIVRPDDQGQRLDRWLSSQLVEESRSEIQRWIKNGAVHVDGRTARPSQKLEDGQSIQIAPPLSAPFCSLVPENIHLDILFENRDVIVINKQAGLVVHPAAGHASGTLVNAVMHHCPDIEGFGGEQRPGIVHRLDKETSGLIVVSKNDRSHRFLQSQFQKRAVFKEYCALAEGFLDPAAGRINAPIGRHPVHRKRQAILPIDELTGESRGRVAITDYETVRRYTLNAGRGSHAGNFSLLRVILHTGRTHQIRVHLAWLRHPVVGDTVYGYKRKRIQLERHFLHAHRLRIRLPGTDEPQEFTAPLPQELQNVLLDLEEV